MNFHAAIAGTEKAGNPGGGAPQVNTTCKDSRMFWWFSRESSLAIWETGGNAGPVPLLQFRTFHRGHLDIAPRPGRGVRTAFLR